MTQISIKRFKGTKHILAKEYNSVIIVSLLTTFSLVPFLVWFGFKYFTDASMYSQLLEDLSNQTQISDLLFTNQIIFSCISLIAIPASFIMLGGLIGYISELNFNFKKRPIKLYFASIKKTVKYALIAGFTTAFICNICALLKWGNGYGFSLAFIVIIILSIIFIYPPLLIFMFEGYIYQGKIKTAIKNAYILFFSEIGWNSLFFYVSAIPLILFFVFQDQFFAYLLLLIMIVYGFGFVLVILSGRIFLLFDKYVNKFNYPELFEKNLINVLEEK